MIEDKSEIIKKYLDELNKYASIASPGIKKLIEEERAPYLKQLNGLYDIYLFQNYLMDNYSGYFPSTLNKTLSLFFVKVASDILCVRQCLMVGQLVSASSIERNILETYIDMKIVMDHDTEDRLLLYEDYQHVQRWLRLTEFKNYIEELKNLEDISEEKRESELEYYNYLLRQFDEKEVNDNYNKVKYKYHPTRPYHWAWRVFKDKLEKGQNLNIKTICKMLNIYNDYMHVYGTSSLAVHNQPLMANMMIRGEGITTIPIFTETTRQIAAVSASLVVEIIMMIMKYSDSPKYEEVEYFLDHLFTQSRDLVNHQ